MKNFYERFASAAERFAARTAVEVQHRDRLDSFTYADLVRVSDAAAAQLAARGVARGDRVALLAENGFTWCAAYFGVLRLGAVVVPLDTAYKSRQVAALLSDSGARLFFTSPRFLDTVREGIALAGVSCDVLLLHAGPGEDAGLPVLARLAAGAARPELPPCPATPEDPAAILYTSGTTSDPKGVVLTHGNLLAEADAVFSVVPVSENDALLGVLPLFHALAQMANLLLPFVVGARVVFLETVNTTELLRALAERNITLFACVPQFFYLIHQRVFQQVAAAGLVKRTLFRLLLGLNGALRRAGLNLGPLFFRPVHAVMGSRMRYLVTGGSRFDPAIGRDLQKLGFNILQAYGLTETSGGACVMRPGDLTIGAVGHPLPGVEVKIAPPERGGEQELPDGEVLIRGPVIMKGYYRRDDVNAVVLRDGWLHTGDLGYLDAGGRLYITGRKKEVIVLSSGKNIYPEEIEAHYQQSPFIKEVCVTGLARPGEPAAERLHAVVVPDLEVMRARQVVNMREVLRFEMESLAAELPSHKRALGFEVWTEDLPRTTTRKLKRFEIERRLRERARAAGEPAAARAASPEDAAWAADPHVARALEMIRDAAKQKDAVHPGANLELELGLDSMERVELLTHLEQAFGVDVSDEAAARIYTVRELVEALRPGSSGGAASGVPAGGAPSTDAWARLLAEADASDPALAGLLRRRPLFSAVMFVKMKFLYALAWLLLGLRVRGREALPPRGPFLLCPNHQSHLDAFLLVSALPWRVFRDIFFVGASEYFQTPLRAWLARRIHLVPVDPDTNLVRAMQAGAFGLRHGKVLILFPEGERSIDGDVKKFKKGAPILSLHLKAPIVPVALDGVHEVWPRGRGFRWRALLPGGPRLAMRFGQAIPPPEPLPEKSTLAQAEALYSAAAERLRARVVEMWQELRAGLSGEAQRSPG